MRYCLYRLNFKTALHIGEDSGKSGLSNSADTIHADTIFSALCHEAIQHGGDKALNRLCESAKSGRIRLSDALPFWQEEYYLPKPIISVHKELSTDSAKERKVFKKLKYIPATRFNDYLGYLKGEKSIDAEELKRDFSMGDIYTRVSIKGNAEPMPYHIGVTKFLDDCGLYIVAAYESEGELDFLTGLLTGLSYSGIGGKRTSGLGRFELDDPIFLEDPYSESLEAFEELLSYAGGYRMALGVCLPRSEELNSALEGSFYSVIRRGGFVQSTGYSDRPLKKKLIYMLSAGSCFKCGFEGDVYDVSQDGGHSVYRYGKPIFLGVNL